MTLIHLYLLGRFQENKIITEVELLFTYWNFCLLDTSSPVYFMKHFQSPVSKISCFPDLVFKTPFSLKISY